MDYRRHYDALVERARTRQLGGYVEKHHIVPRCLGGGDEPENLVELTPEEHYVAHQLLIKLNPGNNRIIFAARAMTISRDGRRGNKLYGWIRRALPDALDEEHKAAQSRAAKGRKFTEAHLRALREAADRRQERNAAKIRAKYAKYISRA